MSLLVQNSKMKKSSVNGITVVNWTIPAFRSQSGMITCPAAKECIAGCYARSGAYMFGNVKSVHEKKLELTQTPEFVEQMSKEILRWLLKRKVKHLKIRIHDAGDFYSLEYLDKWLDIMAIFAVNDRVSFYAYTKEVLTIKQYRVLGRIPTNLVTIFSFGGKHDSQIKPTDRQAKVFKNLEELIASGSADGTDDDLVAAMGSNNKIGLIYHGKKKYENTAWSKVA